MSPPVRLSQDGLFFVLGKICYAMELLQAKFDDEDDSPIGVEEALLQLEESKEPLLQLLLEPIDLRDQFSQYLLKEYEITMMLDLAVPASTDDPLISRVSPMTIVPRAQTENDPPN